MFSPRYKPLFSVSVSYQQSDSTVAVKGLKIDPMPVSKKKMTDFNLLALSKENTSTIYYEGFGKPVAAPVSSEPIFEITGNETFYFGVNFIDKKLIPQLKFHSTSGIARETGFPLLYDASINTPDGPAVFALREDVKYRNAIFTFTAPTAETGITGSYAIIEVRDENNNLIDIPDKITALNDKQIDGVDALPEFAFSIDMSAYPTGIYTFKAGNMERKYFIANDTFFDNHTVLIRVQKNNNLIYHKSLSDNLFTHFDLLIPKA